MVRATQVCSYHLVFDATRKSLPWLLYGAGVLVVLIGALWTIFPTAHHSPNRRRMRWIGVAILAVSSVATITLVMWTVTDRVSALDPTNAKLVEGQVSHFTENTLKSASCEEQFTVANAHFCYRSGSLTPGYNRAAAEGSPIRNGLQVRIRYVKLHGKPTIIRLETANCPAAAPADANAHPDSK